MPRKANPGPEYWKKKWDYQQATGENKDDAERAKARRVYDKAGINRTGKDIDHKKPIAVGGKSTGGNLRLRAKSANQADNGHKPGEKAGKKFKG